MPYKKTRSSNKRPDTHTIEMAPSPSAPTTQSQQQDTTHHYQGFKTCKLTQKAINSNRNSNRFFKCLVKKIQKATCAC